MIILTSNLGSTYLVDRSLSDEQAHELAMEAVKQHFRPEFLNRLDEIIMFNSLSDEALRKILDLLLKKEVKLAGERGLTLEISDAAQDVDAGAERSPRMGRASAAPHHPEERARAAGRLSAGEESSAGTKIRVDVEGEKLKMIEG